MESNNFSGQFGLEPSGSGVAPSALAVAPPAPADSDPMEVVQQEYRHPQGSATVTYKSISKILPLSRLTTFGLAEEFDVPLAEYPYLKTAAAVHEPLDEATGILLGLLDGAHYRLVLGRAAEKKDKRKQQNVGLRGVQRIPAEPKPVPRVLAPPADDDLDMEAPPPKRLKLTIAGVALSDVSRAPSAVADSSSSASASASADWVAAGGESYTIEPVAPIWPLDEDENDQILPDDAEADDQLEAEVTSLAPEEVLSRLSVAPRVRLAPSEIQVVYESLRPAANVRMAPQPIGLTSKLFPYQLAAVAWMVDREFQGTQLSAGIGASNGVVEATPELATPGGVRSHSTSCVPFNSDVLCFATDLGGRGRLGKDPGDPWRDTLQQATQTAYRSPREPLRGT